MGEFDLIKRFFAQQTWQGSEVWLGIGDDCAITDVPLGQSLAITTDTMVENSHFYPNIDPYDLAYKAVATNLSDLASMGARPAWISLALSLPKVDETWLQRFSLGLFAILDRYQVALIGGDTTKSEQTMVGITAHGFIEKSTALCRHQAKEGEAIYVSGTLGDGLAGFYLLRDAYQQGKKVSDVSSHYLIQRNLRPTPRVELGQWLAKNQFSRCAMDLSDGLVGDLKHILQRSGVSAVLNLQDLPCSPELVALYGRKQAELLALQGGEDYELCFTVPLEKQGEFLQKVAQWDIPCTCIGKIVPAHKSPALHLLRNGQAVELSVLSFDHFKS